MATLKVGRVGLDVEVNNVQRIRHQARRGNRSMSLVGEAVSSALASTQALATEMLAQEGYMVALVFSADSIVNGFYLLDGSSIDAQDYAVNDTGLYDFDLDVTYLGSVSEIELQSLIEGDVINNEHGIILSEAQPFHAPAVGALTYDSDEGSPTSTTRTSEDGDVPFFYGIDLDGDPTWSSDPSTYYDGAAEIWVSDRLRAGRYAPNDPANFKLDNGLIRLTPETSGGDSAGGLIFEVYGGAAWESSTQFDIYFNATTKIPEWHYASILYNTPEVVRFRLVRDADEAPPSSDRHILDIELRRGARHFDMVYTWTGGNQEIQVRRDSTDAATAVTPTGASSSPGIEDGSADGDGNKWILASPNAQTQDTTNGRISRAASTVMPFMVGFEVDSSTAATPNTSEDVILQYFGQVSEVVRAVQR